MQHYTSYFLVYAFVALLTVDQITTTKSRNMQYQYISTTFTLSSIIHTHSFMWTLINLVTYLKSYSCTCTHTFRRSLIFLNSSSTCSNRRCCKLHLHEWEKF